MRVGRCTLFQVPISTPSEGADAAGSVGELQMNVETFPGDHAVRKLDGSDGDVDFVGGGSVVEFVHFVSPFLRDVWLIIERVSFTTSPM